MVGLRSSLFISNNDAGFLIEITPFSNSSSLLFSIGLSNGLIAAASSRSSLISVFLRSNNF